MFLGYGLLHTFLDDTLGLLDFWSSEHKANRFSVSQVNDFITKPEVWPRVEKAFLPFIFVISELDEDQSIHMKTWMNNLKKTMQGVQQKPVVLQFSPLLSPIATSSQKLL